MPETTSSKSRWCKEVDNLLLSRGYRELHSLPESIRRTLKDPGLSHRPPSGPEPPPRAGHKHALETFNLLALFLTLAAVFGWLNQRYVRLPATIGLMIISMVFSLVLVALGWAGVAETEFFISLVATLDFDETLLKGMLGALLFAGALHVNLDDLMGQKWAISLLATVGVLTSTLLVGSGAWLLFGWLGHGCSPHLRPPLWSPRLPY